MEDLSKKYDFVEIDGNRYYRLFLNDHKFGFAFSTPYYFHLNGKDYFVKTWNAFTSKILKLIYDESGDKIINEKFSTDWTDRAIFSKFPKDFTFSKKIEGSDYYFDADHTALHTVWIALDALKAAGFELNHDFYVLYKKSPETEPKEVIDFYLKNNKKLFYNYIIYSEGLSEEHAIQILHGINKADEFTRSFIKNNFYSFYLIAEPYNAYNKSLKFFEHYYALPNTNDEKVKAFKYCFNIFIRFLSFERKTK